MAASRACGGGLDLVEAMQMPMSFLTWLLGGAAELAAAAESAHAGASQPAAAPAGPDGLRRVAVGTGREDVGEALDKLRGFLSRRVGG